MRLAVMMSALLAFTSVIAYAQQPLSDPGIPNGETAVYSLKAGQDTAVVTQRVAKTIKGGRAYYEVTAESSLDDIRVLIDAATMAVEYSWVRRKRPDLVTETETKTVKNTVKTGPDEISLADFSGLPYVLRGFPFGRLRLVKIKMAQGSSFVMNLVNTKEVDVKTAAGTFRCYEIELGLDGFLGAFMPKSYFWFNRPAPHFLVRYQGQLAGPGSPEMVLELSRYEVK
jgi:hypothetical protein